MRRDIKTLVFTAAITGTVAVLVQHVVSRLIQRFSKQKGPATCLREVTEDELRGELARWDAERKSLSGMHMMGYMDW